MRRGIDIVRRGYDFLRQRVAHRALILLYHRVAEPASDPYLLCVSPRRFAEHLEVLRRYAQPMSLQSLAAALQEGKLPRKAVVLTFDDGYADNLHKARPILEKYQFPATVFVTAGQVGSRREFWWDELERLMLRPGKLPETLSLKVNGSSITWEAGEAAIYSREDFQGHQGWHIERPDTPGPRQALFRSLYGSLHALPPAERSEALNALQAWAGATPDGRSSKRVLSDEEVVLLAEGGLVEIGAHTLTHPSLADLSASQQREEILGSQARLEEILSRPVKSIAYPHGSYNQETLAIVREANFNCACSSHTDAVWRGADPFGLPRISVRNWDGEAFARWLKAWLGTG